MFFFGWGGGRQVNRHTDVDLVRLEISFMYLARWRRPPFWAGYKGVVGLQAGATG